ncbi:MAG: GAF domain-containing protein [Bacillota bacterium]|nr:GAF domain-containing protein [Bacillota bacterium]
MYKYDDLETLNDEERLKLMLSYLDIQLQDEDDDISNLSNASAIIASLIDNLNWAGFYLLKNEELILGPFQGRPACNRIKIGNGVCGTAVKEGKIIMVHDVHDFPGHIACDTASNSEIVIPIIKNNVIYGVLDIDSPIVGRFTDLEKKYFERFVQKLTDKINWDSVVK